MVSIVKVHQSVTTRSVRFDHRCQSCGNVEPTVVQASTVGTSVNRLGVFDLLIDHDHEAQQAARDNSLALARQRARLTPCPECGFVDQKALAQIRSAAKREGLVPTVIATILVGPALGGLVAMSMSAYGLTHPQLESLLDAARLPVALVCVALVGWVTWRYQVRKAMKAFDEELIDLEGNVVFRSRDPERYYEIVESGAYTEG